MLAERGLARLVSPNWQLAACSGMHVVNDALFAGLYPLLPLLAVDLGLTYAEVGAIKTAYTGAAGLFQVPASLAAERWGEQLLLGLGTTWVGAGLVGMTLSTSFSALLVLSVVAGLGGNFQHPAAASVISRLFDSGRRATALGTLNFAGDLGKVLAPAVAGGVALAIGWRGGFLALGAIGLLFGLLYLLTVPQPPALRPAAVVPGHAATYWGIAEPVRFIILASVGILDAAARATLLTFLPFLLGERGIDAGGITLAFAALFAAGAAGKFVCGVLADRVGSVGLIVATELVTAGAILTLLGAPVVLLPLVVLPLGFVLNGTSSVLYAFAAELVDSSKRARGYGLFYTCVQLASAVAPLGYGVLADRLGLNVALVALGGATALIAPLALALRVKTQD
jgi:FSR family fosmidomycin resistance protein-like MFS transporter